MSLTCFCFFFCWDLSTLKGNKISLFFKIEIENHLKESHNTKNDEIIKKLITIKTTTNNHFAEPTSTTNSTLDSKNSTSTINQNNIPQVDSQGKQIKFH